MLKNHESYDDYIKAIFLISKNNKGGWISNSEISHFLSVKPSSVTNMLYNLKEHKLIDWNPRKSIRLTKKGRERARMVLKRYNSLFDFFSQVLKVQNKNIIQKLSCEIEHHVNSDVCDALDKLVMKS